MCVKADDFGSAAPSHTYRQQGIREIHVVLGEEAQRLNQGLFCLSRNETLALCV